MAGTDEADDWLAEEPDANDHSSPDEEDIAEKSSSGKTAHTLPDEPLLQALIGRVVDRDEAALASLYGQLVGQVYGLALRITQSKPLAEEVAQDVFWQIWRQAPRFDPVRGSALSWIMTIARSRSLDTLRRIEPKECELKPEILGALASPEHDSPMDLLEAVQQGHAIQAALAKLEPLPRQLLALAFFRGFSHDEIAGHAGLPLGTVKSHIRRALVTLRQALTPVMG